MIIYVAGPYRGETEADVDRHIQSAREIAIKLWEHGHVALCPHLNTARFELDCRCSVEDYLQGDLELLTRCDAIVMTPDWENSTGARGEYEFAKRLGIPTYTYPDFPECHPTELRRPKQVRAFIETAMQMYRVHLQKNADYSPANILGAGEIGIMTRVWDKVARLMNLMGFKIEIASSYYDHPEMPKCEAVDDTILDLAVYAIIWQLHRKGVWGK